eukprot:TRINITY_DN14686_c0_g1_i1.p1 TRINITY_DN14686_c0_g1~~TRINITY_DN14686_c0_g1_i1.p1  ORF type:complete len:184 (-),score=26.32 TRINITY_DN14686_c0_g1_i1:194-745(-)
MALMRRISSLTHGRQNFAQALTTQAASAQSSKVSQDKPTRQSFPHFLPIQTRWMDNDTYGHVNNVVYYSYFDTVVNEFLIRKKVLDPKTSPVIGLVVETQCRYFRSLSFPEVVDAGLRVATIGRSSVRYEIGLFKQADEEAAAIGHFVHVYVDRDSQRPTQIPQEMRKVLNELSESVHQSAKL